MDAYTIISSVCVKHKDEPVTSFCNKHGQTVCRKCLMDVHKNCRNTNRVDDIADALERADRELPNAIDSFDRLATRSKDWMEKYETALKRLQRSEEKLTTGIEQMQVRMIEKVNKLAAEALEIVNSVIGTQKSIVQRDIDHLQESNKTVTNIQYMVLRCRGGKQISVEHAISMLDAVDQLDSTLTKTNLKDRNIKILFYVSEELQYMKHNLKSFGRLCVEDIHNINSDKCSRNSIISLGPLVNIGNLLDDNVDDSVFVMPTDTYSDRDSLYVRIDRPDSIQSCSPPPPPLPDMHPVAPVADAIGSGDRTSGNFQTLPRRNINKRANHHSSVEVKKSNTFINTINTSDILVIPPLPKKRTRLSTSTTKTSINEANATPRVSALRDTPDDPSHEAAENTIYDTPPNIQPSQPSGGELKFHNGKCTAEAGSNRNNPNKNVDKQIPPEKKLHAPTLIEQIIRDYENNTKVDQNSLMPTSAKRTHVPCSDKATVSSKPIVSTASSAKGSGIFVNRSPDIPPLPKTSAHAQNQYKLAVDKLIRTEDDSEQRHSYDQTSSSNFDWTIKEPVTSSSISDLTRRTPTESKFHDLSGSSTWSSRHSNNSSSVEKRNSGSVVSFNSEISNMDKSHPEVTFQMRPHKTKLSTNDGAHNATDSRKSKTFSLVTSMNPNIGVPGRAVPIRHSTITGIAVTSSGMLFICDTENHCLQLFDTSGLRLYDYKLREPFSCCRVRDELIAVTSNDRKTLCIFDLSNSTITCKQEQPVAIDAQVFGVDYMNGFFGVCCGDRVVILTTETLQPYRIVKPMVTMKKKRSEAYFVDVKYVAVDWSAQGFYIYTSEHKNDRVSCIAVGNKDRLVWACRIGKPNSIILSKGQLFVAGKGKIVVLDTESGQRLRDIRHDVPSHPVHMVIENDWLYLSKSSTSNEESRNIRRIPIF